MSENLPIRRFPDTVEVFSGESVRLRLDLAYDGAAFSGWAVQPDRRTVQGVLEWAFARILRLDFPPRLTVAGRTDAGVHAHRQVAHVDLATSLWRDGYPALLRRLQRVLPEDIQLYSLQAVPPEFDARFSALWRRYQYRIADANTQLDPVRRGFVLSWPRALDVEAMHDAAQRFIGEHDFVAFCRFRPNATSIRRLDRFDIARDGATGEVLCELKADAFCHSMVRSLVGALIAVGEGRHPKDWPASLLTRTSRADEVTVAAPHGLTLVEVAYPQPDEFAPQAARTRRLRVLPEPRSLG